MRQGEVGMEIHLDRVPLRQSDMEPFEILLSESQERMLVVVERERSRLLKIFSKSGIYTQNTSVRS